MEYTVQKLGRLAGISTRTLRYYDEIGLLKPARINSSGYRIYGDAEVDRLQHILFYRSLGFGLERIQSLMDSPSFDGVQALTEHRRQLLERRQQLDQLIVNVERTIQQKEGKIHMTDEQKFEGFKRQLLKENEDKYGEEIRERYGDDMIDQSNQKFLNQTAAEAAEMERLNDELAAALCEGLKNSDPGSELGQRTAELHKMWLMHYWPSYSPEAHAGLAEMYIADERFKAYYERIHPGAAEFLRDAIRIYTGAKLP